METIELDIISLNQKVLLGLDKNQPTYICTKEAGRMGYGKYQKLIIKDVHNNIHIVKNPSTGDLPEDSEEGMQQLMNVANSNSIYKIKPLLIGLLKEPIKPNYIWMWQKDNLSFDEYNPKVSELIEKAYEEALLNNETSWNINVGPVKIGTNHDGTDKFTYFTVFSSTGFYTDATDLNNIKQYIKAVQIVTNNLFQAIDIKGQHTRSREAQRQRLVVRKFIPSQ
jgi:hypothetical protein